MAKIQYADGTTTKRPPLNLPFVGRRAMWPIEAVRLDVKKLEGRDYEWAVQNIKQTERMSGNRLPSIWFPGTFGLQCDVLYYDDTKMILQNSTTVYELLK
jgi:hypothetical protein